MFLPVENYLSWEDYEWVSVAFSIFRLASSFYWYWISVCTAWKAGFWTACRKLSAL